MPGHVPRSEGCREDELPAQDQVGDGVEIGALARHHGPSQKPRRRGYAVHAGESEGRGARPSKREHLVCGTRLGVRNLESEATAMYRRVSRDFFARSSTEKYLGHVLALHRLVRHDAGVPFHQGIADGPATDDHVVYGETKMSRKLIGSLVSIMYEALPDDCDCKALHSIIDQIKANENGVNGSANEHMNRDRGYFDKVARPF